MASIRPAQFQRSTAIIVLYILISLGPPSHLPASLYSIPHLMKKRICIYSVILGFYCSIALVHRRHEQNLITYTQHKQRLACKPCGATENAGVENAIRSKLQGWKMQEWKMQE